MNQIFTTFLFLLIISLSACSNTEYISMEQALSCSGKNQTEIKKIQKHYQNDNKKNAASRFLICNMIGKQVIDSNSIKKSQLYFKAFSDHFQKEKSYQNSIQYIICDSLKQLYPDIKSHPQYLTDIQHISSNFIIQHIDHCFLIWQTYPWCKDINFETFCKYILPYTTSNCYWEDALKFFDPKYAILRDSVYHKSYKEIGKIISDDIDKTFLQNWVLFSSKHKGLLPTTFHNLATAQIGTCLEANIYKIAALRANGIPATLNTIPNWGNANSSHFWTEIIGYKQGEKLYDNTQRPYMSPKDILVDNIFWKNIYNPAIKDTISNIHIQYCRTIPKVYRINYEIQAKSLAMQAQEEIPDFFKNPGIEDITNQYIVCKDIEIPLWENRYRKKHVYLCCYDSEKWIPVCWSNASKKKAKFKQVGINVLYMPTFYHNQEVIPAGDIFTITTDGNIKFFKSNPKSIIQEATFFSKMPYRIHTALQAASTLKTDFFACNKQDLSDRILVHTIDQVPFYKDSFKIKTNDTFRYLVCSFQNVEPSEDPFSIAEIKFFDESGTSMKSILTGTKGLRENKLENLIDDDRVSFYQPNKFEEKQYITFDFGKRVRIKTIEFYPRSDDNRIVSGELYELFYWNKKWISLGQQYAENDKLIFHDIPQGALYHLHNHTRGKEHRPFTYNNDQQIWW